MITLRTAILQALYPRRVLTTEQIADAVKTGREDNSAVTHTTMYRLRKKLLVEQGDRPRDWKLTASGKIEAKQDRALFKRLMELQKGI